MQNQFSSLQNWMHVLLNDIKKEIKSDHLDSDPEFYKNYFGNRPKNKLTLGEIFSAYEAELTKGNQKVAEWVVNRWVFKHADLYQVFADRLSQINPQFDQIENLSEEEAFRVLEGSQERFGAIPTFLFVILNGVVFPDSIKNDLLKKAEEEKNTLAAEGEKEEEEKSLQKVIETQKREIVRLHDKLLGVQKKYDKDVEALKKQIRALQKR